LDIVTLEKGLLVLMNALKAIGGAIVIPTNASSNNCLFHKSIQLL